MNRETVMLKKTLYYLTLVREIKEMTNKNDKHDESEYHTKY